MSAGPVTAVRFEDQRRALALFAQALTGVPPLLLAHGEPAPPRDGGAVGSGEWRITLPAVIERHATAAENRAAYRLLVLHQVLRLNTGALQFDIDGWLIGQRRKVVLRRLLALLEGMRLAAVLRREYPGAVPDLVREQALALAARPPRMSVPPHIQALQVLQRWALGDDAAELPGLSLAVHAAALRSAGATVHDSAAAAMAIARQLGLPAAARSPHAATRPAVAAPSQAASRLPLPSEADTDAADADAATFDIDGWSAGLDDAPTLPTRVASSRRVTGVAAADNVAERSTDPQAPTPQTPLARRTSRSAASHHRRAFVDEWDYQARAYRRAWCTIDETRAPGHDPLFIAELHRRHGALARTLRRRFQALRIDAPERPRRDDDGDEIDLDGAIERAADRRAGQGDDRAPYLHSRHRRSEVCAAFLLDTSASTDFPLRDPGDATPALPPTPAAHSGGASLYEIDDRTWEPPPVPRRRVIDVARDALALMGEALQSLGDRHAFYTFDGEGRHHVRFQVAKRFDEPPSARTWGALAGLRPRGATRTGAAVRHATRQLARQSAARRLLFVVTDGYPEDSDYGPWPRDVGYGLHDTAQALREAERAGITTFCIAIDHAGHDYLRRICRASRYLVIDDVDALPEQLGAAYLALRRGGGNQRSTR